MMLTLYKITEEFARLLSQEGHAVGVDHNEHRGIDMTITTHDLTLPIEDLVNKVLGAAALVLSHNIGSRPICILPMDLLPQAEESVNALVNGINVRGSFVYPHGAYYDRLTRFDVRIA